MKNNLFKNVPLLLATLICFSIISLPASLLAADADVSMGAGLAVVPDYEGSEDATVAPALFLDVKWEDGYYVKLFGNQVRGNVLPSKNWSFGPVLQYRGARNSNVSNNRVEDMKNVDSALEAGMFAGFNAEGWDANLQWVTDTSNSHDGSLTTLSGGYSFRWLGMGNRVGVSGTYADSDYMDTYFGVGSGDARRSGLRSYNADSGLKDVGMNLMSRYTINSNWDLMGLFGYKQLLNDAKDSPVVDDEGSDRQYNIGILAIYNF